MASDENVASLLPWSRTVRTVRARRKAAELLKREDADRTIAAMTPLEVYFTVKELGPEAAGPVLALLSPEQIQPIFDLDGWRQGALAISDVLLWLEAFREAGPDALVRAARTLDPEALATLLRRRLLITLRSKEDASDPIPVPAWAAEPPDVLLPLVETPDGRFIIAARTEDESEEDEDLDEDERKGVLQLVDELYRERDWEYVAGVLRMAMDDLTSPMEEECYRFRSARLEDLGFPERSRALEVYGLMEPEVLARPSAPYPTLPLDLPALYTRPLADGLFSEAMDRLSATEMERVAGDLVPVANAALVADGREPGDLGGVEETLLRMRGYLELALAHGVPGAQRVEVAAERLRQQPVATLFRVGHTLTQKRKTRALRLSKHPALRLGERPLGLLESGELAVVEALLSPRPRFLSTLDPLAARLAAGEPESKLWEVWPEIGLPRPFGAPEELAAVDYVLSALEALASYAAANDLRADAEGDVLPALPERNATVLVTTAAANVLLGRPFAVQPLQLADLERLGALLPGHGGWPTSLAARIERGLAEVKSSLSGGRSLVTGVLRKSN